MLTFFRERTHDKIQVVARIRATLLDHAVPVADGRVISLSVSCGTAVYPDDVSGPGELFRVADANMYRDKGSA